MTTTTLLVLVHQQSAFNATLTVSVGGQVIGTVLQDAPKVWIAKPPGDAPRHASLEEAVEWLLAQRPADDDGGS